MKPIRPKTLILVTALSGMLALLASLSALIGLHQLEKKVETEISRKAE